MATLQQQVAGVFFTRYLVKNTSNYSENELLLQKFLVKINQVFNSLDNCIILAQIMQEDAFGISWGKLKIMCLPSI